MEKKLYQWKSNDDYKSVYHFWNVFVISVTHNEYNFLETLKEGDDFIVRGADVFKSDENNKVTKDIYIEHVESGNGEIYVRYYFKD
jgi:hypothetical protein